MLVKDLIKALQACDPETSVEATLERCDYSRMEVIKRCLETDDTSLLTQMEVDGVCLEQGLQGEDEMKVTLVGTGCGDPGTMTEEVKRTIAEADVLIGAPRLLEAVEGYADPGILKVVNPTAFHVPVGGVLEWATIEDSGRLLAQICEDWVPEDFWNKAYNISSGGQYRMTNYEFMNRMLSSLGLPSPEKVFEPQWFALKNFHGMWYKDADILDEILHFRANVPVDEYFATMKSKLPWYYSLAFLAPAWAVRMFMKPFAFEKGLGTQWWVENDPEKFEAYYGSREAYDAIRSWDDIRPAPVDKWHAE